MSSSSIPSQPATLLARTPQLATLAQLEGYPSAGAQTGEVATLLAQFVSQSAGSGPILADQYAYAQLSTEQQRALSAQHDVHLLDTADLSAMTAALTPQTAFVYTTTLQQPLFTVPDLPALAELAARYAVPLLIDSTLTPLLTTLPQPSSALYTQVTLLYGQKAAVGALLGPAARPNPDISSAGLATLPLRQRQHSQHAQAAADVLAAHPQVRAVYYPGLSTHPQFEAAAERFSAGFGGLLGLEVRHEHFGRNLARVWQEGGSAGTPQSHFWQVDTAGQTVWQLWLGLEDISQLLDELEAALE